MFLIAKFSRKIKRLLMSVLPVAYYSLGRNACGGLEVFRLRNEDNFQKAELCNLQKARLDLLMQWSSGKMFLRPML